MIELLDDRFKNPDRHSSKGNQLKWKQDGIWYKADFTGYEGLAEYVVSELLNLSDLDKTEFVRYETEEIKYRNHVFNGAKSKSFLEEDWQIITLERLFKNQFNQSLYTAIWSISDVKDRLKFLCEQTERITGLTEFGKYMAKLLTIDAFFLNEDRHTHNIAVLMNASGKFKLCPIFDNGAALLADIKLDYPLDENVFELMEKVQAKTISSDFDEQLDAAEELYGQQIRFCFDKNDIDRIIDSADKYGKEEKERVRTVLYEQFRKYRYLF